MRPDLRDLRARAEEAAIAKYNEGRPEEAWRYPIEIEEVVLAAVNLVLAEWPTSPVHTDAPGARTSDPSTSAEAAAAIRVTARNQRGKLLWAYVGADDLTDEEAATQAPGVSMASEFSKRCSELREAGFIEPVLDEHGEPVTRVSSAGMARMVCTITMKGLQALEEMGEPA